MRWAKWATLALAVAEAGWMTFDGARALVVGDYVTPPSGEHAGDLGPWATLVERVGIEPRSTFMKLVFVLYGSGWLAAAAVYARGSRGSRRAMAAAASGSPWYLVFGTVASAVQLVLLALEARSASNRASSSSGIAYVCRSSGNAPRRTSSA